MIPGINLLNVAMGMLGSQSVEYAQYMGTTTLENGVKIESYADPITIDDCSVQPIPKSNYRENGLNFSREYVTWWVSRDVLGLDRDFGGDKITWNGKTWIVDSDVSWFEQDGWCELTMWNVEKPGNAP